MWFKEKLLDSGRVTTQKEICVWLIVIEINDLQEVFRNEFGLS